MRLDRLTEMQIDALREIGNIGAGHAAMALSQLMGHGVELTVPELDFVPFCGVPTAFGGSEQLVGAVHCHLVGAVGGGMMFVSSRDSVLNLVDLLHNRPAGITKSFGAEEEALLTHVGGILVGAYVAALARLADIDVIPSTPSFALDMAGAILEAAAAEVGGNVETTLLVRSRFTGEDSHVEASVFFLPDPDSLEVILGKLGLV